MIVREYTYYDHNIEIHEHPVYGDFEYVVKYNDGKVAFASTHPYEEVDEAQHSAELKINHL